MIALGENERDSVPIEVPTLDQWIDWPTIPLHSFVWLTIQVESSQSYSETGLCSTKSR